MTKLQTIIIGLIALVIIALVAVIAVHRQNQRLLMRTASGRLQLQMAQVVANNKTAANPTASTPLPYADFVEANPEEEAGRRIGEAVVYGDPDAMNQLANLARMTLDNFNAQNISETNQDQISRQAFGPLWAAFKVLDGAAANGNQNAVHAYAKAVQIPELRGITVQSLGALAARGNDAALDILLHPQKYGLLISSTVGALKGAADNGNQKAIDALTAVANDENAEPLWLMVASNLKKAAAAGNSTAIDALVTLAEASNPSVRREAIAGLQAAATNQNAKAAEALQKLDVK